MNEMYKNQTISHNERQNPENIRNGQCAMESGDKTRNHQRRKKVLKPKHTRTSSATTRQQQCSSNNTPCQTTYTNRTGARPSVSDINAVLLDDQKIRMKHLRNELVEARMKADELMKENRLLKTVGKRQEQALSAYEGEQAKLPRIIRSYEEDIRALQNRVRRMKTAFNEMENRYKSQTNELLVLQKQHKHLLSLSKNKELSNREELRRQLEEAHNTIGQQQCEIQNYAKQLELRDKTIKRMKDENQNVGLKTKRVSARQNATGTTGNSINITPRVKPIVPKIYGQGDSVEESNPIKPEPSYGNNPVGDKPFSSSGGNILSKSRRTVEENKTHAINDGLSTAKTPASRILKDKRLGYLNRVGEEKIEYGDDKSRPFKQSVNKCRSSSSSSNGN